MKFRKFIILFSIFWTLITGVFISVIAYGAVNQFRTRTWTETSGVVNSSKVTISHGSKSTTYGIAIHYAYAVAGQKYESDRVRFAQWSSSGSHAAVFVRQHPAGSLLAIYYDPANPAEAVLVRGLEGMDYFLALFITPFTVVMVGTWFAIAAAFRKRSGFAGLSVDDEVSHTRLRPSLFNIFYGFAAGVGGAAFITIFVVAFATGGFDASIRVAQAAWMAVLVAGCAPGIIVGWLILSGHRDLLLDDAAKTLRLPGRVMVPYAGIRQVRIVANYQQAARVNNQPYPAYEVWLG